MTGPVLLRTVGVLAVLMLAVGIIASSGQEVLSPKPMINQPYVRSGPHNAPPAPKSQVDTRPASPSQAVAGAEAIKPEFTEEIADWQLQCFPKLGRACRLAQRQINPKNKSLVIWVELTKYMQPKAAWQMVVMLPLGFRLAPILGLRAGGKLLLNMTLVTCVPAGCVYSAEMPVAALDTLKDSTTLGTEIDNLKGQRFAINVSMRGFSQAYLKTERVTKDKNEHVTKEK